MLRGFEVARRGVDALLDRMSVRGILRTWTAAWIVGLIGFAAWNPWFWPAAGWMVVGAILVWKLAAWLPRGF